MAGRAGDSPFGGAERLAEPTTIDQLRLAWRLLTDPRVSALKYAAPVVAALYLFSPVDVVPDFLVGIGQVDDLGVAVAMVLVAIRLLPRLAPTDVVAQHRAAMAERRPDRNDGPTGDADGPTYEGSFRVRNGSAGSANDWGNL